MSTCHHVDRCENDRYLSVANNLLPVDDNLVVVVFDHDNNLLPVDDNLVVVVFDHDNNLLPVDDNLVVVVFDHVDSLLYDLVTADVQY